MIKTSTIDQIINTVRIDEVVGEFVSLKKRGVNYVACCPFHNEKSPSFTVSPTKGLYKCFGCGKAGNSVHFIMEHESMSYPEALRFLAQKYNIEIEEDKNIDADQVRLENKERESLLVAIDWSSKYFEKTLFDNEEGQNIGLSYFEERGYRHDTMHKFGLGYCLNQWDGFINAATTAGYKTEYLEKGGLIKQREDGTWFDFFKGRVMFPIHNLTGKVIGFGGRVLEKNAKTAKYLNSPESDVYHKSDVLYGIYFAKKAIKEHDNCYLVEGYTDVVTLHQGGVENVVASSGTSLTEGQIKLIKRFTDNVTVLYDGDFAGIKASLRGIDMLLENGLNVNVVAFPEGEDPDSYCKTLGGEAFAAFLKKNKKDFITFKSDLLLKDAEGPIGKAEVMRNVAESVAKIADSLKREVYIKELSSIFDLGAEIFTGEIARIRRQKRENTDPGFKEATSGVKEKKSIQIQKDIFDYWQERDLVRVLLLFGDMEMNEGQTVAEFVFLELENNGIELEDNLSKTICEYYDTLKGQGKVPNTNHFVNHPDPSISQFTVTALTEKYLASPHWFERYEIQVKSQEQNYLQDVVSAINRLKLRKTDKLMEIISDMIKNPKDDEEQELNIKAQQEILEMRKALSKTIGSVVIR
ncbi:MAG: DNA primase [Bacteroidota bacterium]|nr:DNA primase [Bacteroidota bacterium]